MRDENGLSYVHHSKLASGWSDAPIAHVSLPLSQRQASVGNSKCRTVLCFALQNIRKASAVTSTKVVRYSALCMLRDSPVSRL